MTGKPLLHISISAYLMDQVCSKAIFGNLGVNKNCQKWKFLKYPIANKFS